VLYITITLEHTCQAFSLLLFVLASLFLLTIEFLLDGKDTRMVILDWTVSDLTRRALRVSRIVRDCKSFRLRSCEKRGALGFSNLDFSSSGIRVLFSDPSASKGHLRNHVPGGGIR
jgi:hypothetical protein